MALGKTSRAQRLIGNFVEQFRHALPVVTASDDFGEHDTDVNYLYFRTLCHVLLLRERVRHDQLLQRAGCDGRQRVAAQYPVRDEPEDSGCACLREVRRGETQRSARVGHVVHENGDFVFDVADEDHPRDFVRFFSLLVKQRKVDAEPISYRRGPGERVAKERDTSVSRLRDLMTAVKAENVNRSDDVCSAREVLVND